MKYQIELPAEPIGVPYDIEGRYLQVLKAQGEISIKYRSTLEVELERFEQMDFGEGAISKQARINIVNRSGIAQTIVLFCSDLVVNKKRPTDFTDAVVGLQAGTEVGIDPNQNAVSIPAGVNANIGNLPAINIANGQVVGVDSLPAITIANGQAVAINPAVLEHNPLPHLTIPVSGSITLAANPDRVKILVSCPSANTGDVVFAGSANTGVWIKKNVSAHEIEGSNAIEFTGNDGDLIYISEIVRA